MEKLNKHANDIGLFVAIFTGRLFYDHFVSYQSSTLIKFILYVSFYVGIYFIVSSIIKGICHLKK